MDLFRCESMPLRSYWVMVVMDVFTRRIIGFSAQHAPVDGVGVCRMFNLFGSNSPPLAAFVRLEG